MSSIKSLADELRAKIKSQDIPKMQQEIKKQGTVRKAEKAAEAKKGVDSKITEKEAADFFTAVNTFTLNGSEKLLIRLDIRTTNLLKQLKLAKGIDMNKFIAYSLADFLEQHKWLSPYIKETLKNTEL